MSDWAVWIATGAALGVAAIALVPKFPDGKRLQPDHAQEPPIVSCQDRRAANEEAKSALPTHPKLQKFFGVDSSGADTSPIVLPEGDAVKKAISEHPHLQKFFGVDDEGQEELMEISDSENDGVLVSMALSIAVGLVVTGAVCVAANILSNGDFGRLLLGLFPVEMEALRLTQFLMTFHVR